MGENTDDVADFVTVKDSGLVYIPVEKGLKGLSDFALVYRKKYGSRLLAGLLGIYFYQKVNGEYKQLGGSAVRVLHAEKLNEEEH